MSKKNMIIDLYTSELIYDVQNKTYLTGRSRDNGQNVEEVANMQANNDDENANQIVRSIGNAFSNLKTELSEYIVDNGTTSNNVLLDATKNIKLTITLAMPNNFNTATRDTLATAMHQYVVNSAIGDWFGITNKDDANGYAALTAANLGEIRKAINKRVRPTRTTE